MASNNRLLPWCRNVDSPAVVGSVFLCYGCRLLTGMLEALPRPEKLEVRTRVPVFPALKFQIPDPKLSLQLARTCKDLLVIGSSRAVTASSEGGEGGRVLRFGSPKCPFAVWHACEATSAWSCIVMCCAPPLHVLIVGACVNKLFVSTFYRDTCMPL